MRSKKNCMISIVVLMFKLKVLSINLKLRAPRLYRISICSRNSTISKGTEFLSKDDKQNSHLNGQPRDASTYSKRLAKSSSV